MNRMIPTYDNTKDLYELVHRAAQAYGEAPYLRWEEEGLIRERSFEEFGKRCDAFGVFLQGQEQPAGRALHVGLLGTGSDPFLTALLGTMAAGCVAVPFDRGSSEAELASGLAQMDVDLLVCDAVYAGLGRKMQERIPGLREILTAEGEAEGLRSVEEVVREATGKSPAHDFTPERPALIVFSSGTTGKRKGVVLSHGNLIDNLFNSEGLFHPEGEVYLNVLPLHHVYCIANDVLWVFCYGRPLCLNREMSQIIRHMQMFQPSIMFVVPAIAKGLFGYTMAFAKKHPEMSLLQAKQAVLGKRLYKLFCGGGALSPQLSDALGKMGIMAAQGYGMSECSPKITYLDWSRPETFTSVGRPAKRMQLRIVDGEIQVKGPSVMLGYYKDSQETAAAFTEDGWLMTGDLGYQDEEGFLYLTGRKKNIIVLENGENVSPEQIEAKFADDALIADVMVLAKDDVVAAEIYPDLAMAQRLGITDVKAAIERIIEGHNRELPFYQQIKSFTVREEPFAKTTSGKLIRPQYLTAAPQKEEVKEERALPAEKLSARVRQAVEALLGEKTPAEDGDLFEAGLDSLGGILLLSQLEEAGIALSWEELVAHPTMQAILAAAREKAGAPAAYPVREVYPLTNMQIWFAHILRGNTTANLPFLIRLQEGTDVERLREAVAGAIDRHPGIKGEIYPDGSGRFGFHRRDEEAAQVSVREVTGEEWEKIRPTLVRAYGYTQGEHLYRACIYRTPGADYLFLDVGHIVSDGMTMTILFQDIESLYAGREVAAERYTYFDFVLDEQKRNALGLRARDLAYFAGQMEGYRITKNLFTRTDFPHPEKGDFGVLRGAFPRLSRAAVKEFCRSCGISDNILFHAAFDYTVAMLRNEKDAACCTIHSGRTDGRWARLAGPLFMSCYFRFRQEPGETVREALRRLAAQNRETMKCFVSNLKCDEMFFQYQGDFLRMNRYEKIWAESLPLQLESQPFHLQILAGENGFAYEQRYWKNRMEEGLLKVFLQCLEAVVLAMMTEERVEDLRGRLPQTVIPQMAMSEGQPARVVDDAGFVQPYGGWGHLQVLSEGAWKDTGRTARILPDGRVHDLRSGGQKVMIEGLRGRQYVDLTKVSEAIAAKTGVRPESCFTAYSPDNTMQVYAEVKGEIWDSEKIRSVLGEAFR